MIRTIAELVGGFVAASLVWVVYCACVLAGRCSRAEEAAQDAIERKEVAQ